MRKILFLLILLLFLPIKANALEITAPEAPDIAQGYMPEDITDFSSGVWEVLGRAIDRVLPDLQEAARVCMGLLASVLLVSMVQTASDRIKQTANLTGTAAIASALLLSSNSLMTLGANTIQEMSEYGKLLLPVLTAALAAQGGGTASAALYGGSAMFLSFLSSFISRLLLPLVYLYLGLAAANAATGEAMLKRLKELLKWAMSWSLKTILTVFTAFLSITGIVSGTVDSAALKAAKSAISTAVPVVGGILSNSAETILAGAAVVKNAAGIYGILAILAIFLEPFLRISMHYLLLKLTAAVTAVFGCKEMSDLVGDFSEAMGFLLGMTGSVCVLLLISAVCFLKGVG